MSTDTYEKYGGDDDLEKSRYALRTYTGEVVRPKGVGSVKVEYEGQKCDLPVTVVDLDTPTLMGRDWLKSLRLNWEELFGDSKAVNKTEVEDQRVVDLMEEFEEVFTEKLGCLKDFEVHIPVDGNVTVQTTRNVTPSRRIHALFYEDTHLQVFCACNIFLVRRYWLHGNARNFKFTRKEIRARKSRGNPRKEILAWKSVRASKSLQ